MVMAMPISPAPQIAASWRVSPVLCIRSMFSATTTELSTNSPTLTINASIEMMLID